jgi:hypothetical protein
MAPRVVPHESSYSFHCVVIEGVFASDPAGGVIFHDAAGLDANAIAEVQERARRRLLRSFVRRGLLAANLSSVPARKSYEKCADQPVAAKNRG